MSPINFLFAIHNHQPVGNFDSVFEKAFNECYLPQIEVLKRHPAVRMAIHDSGPLFEWIEVNKPEYFNLISPMVDSGQIEVLSGGFYEPILSVIPEEDAIGQVVMMNDYIKKRFGYKPQGVWLAERVWDLGLPKIIAQAGLRYTLLDDTHFYYAGLSGDAIDGYYMTETHGHKLAVFPINKELRYSIPFHMPDEVINYLLSSTNLESCLGVTYGDDGEKFGMWPETGEWVFKKGWLENFYTALEENSDRIKMPHFCEFLDQFPSKGRLYFPVASYKEMSKWSLNPEASITFQSALSELEDINKRDLLEPFLHGGIWHNFLAKYEESNRMHKKMIFVSGKLKRTKTKLKDSLLSEAIDGLYKGQCNCAYWHGMFGGLYLNYLRHALYSNIIKTENLINDVIYDGDDWVNISQLDFNADGSEDVLLENKKTFALIAPSKGGAMNIFDYRPNLFSLTNTLSRRKEAYHFELGKDNNSNSADQPVSIHDAVKLIDGNCDDLIIYDQKERHCFQDRFISHNTNIKDYNEQTFRDYGDFISNQFILTKTKKNRDEKSGVATVEAEMTRDGHIYMGNVPLPLTMKKTFSLIDRKSVV